MLCIYGDWPKGDWAAKDARTLLFIQEGAAAPHPRARTFILGPLWEWELAALARELIFSRIHYLCPDARKKARAERFFAALRGALAEEELRFSDARDFGVQVLRNALHNCTQLSKSLFGPALAGCCAGIPAIVCGASPSLAYAKPLHDRALFIAGGTAAMALNAMGIEPHAQAYLDPDPPEHRFCAERLPHVPLFYQMRFSHALLSRATGPLVWMPESGHWPFERFLREACGVASDSMDVGWTSGTFAAAIAVHLGCNPIILAGMDFCCEEETYACHLSDEEHAGEFIAWEGKKTKRDWVASAAWLAGLMRQTPEITWVHLTKSGLPIARARRMEEAHLPPLPAPLPPLFADARMPSPEACTRAQEQCTASLARARDLIIEERIVELEAEWCYAAYLLPLWEMWRSLLLRAGGEEKLHKLSLFTQALNAFHG